MKQNPYDFNLPVSDDMFYGRIKERDSIVNNLLAYTPKAQAIVGGRRIGKTSLLEAVHHSLEELQSANKYNLIPIPILIKLSGEIPDSPSIFFSLIGDLTQHVLGRWLGRDSLKFTEASSISILKRFFVEWGNLLVEQRGMRFRLILLLDECEQIVRKEWATDVYSGLHSLISDKRTRSLVTIVMAGSHHFYTQVHQKGSHLKDVITTFNHLYAFNKSDIEALLSNPLDTSLPEDVIDTIISATGGHPYLIQYIMYNLYEVNLPSITVSDVDEIINNFLHNQSNFIDWVDDISDIGLKIFYMIANTENGLSEYEIRTQLIEVPMNLPQIIDTICSHGIAIKNNNGKYQVAGQMFKEWFDTNLGNQFKKQNLSNKKMEASSMPNDEVYDIFLSHSHSDAKWVENLARKLEDQEGLRVWLDKWVLIPGEPWTQNLEKGLSQAKACAVLLGEDIPDGWFRKEIGRANNRQAGETTFRVIPVLLPGTTEEHTVDFLDLYTWVDFREDENYDEAFRRLVAGIRGISPGRKPKY